MKQILISLIASMLSPLSKHPIFAKNKLLTLWAQALNCQDWDRAEKLHSRIAAIYTQLQPVDCNFCLDAEEKALFESIIGIKYHEPRERIMYGSFKVQLVMHLIWAMSETMEEGIDMRYIMEDLHNATKIAACLGIELRTAEKTPEELPKHINSRNNQDIVSYALAA